MTIRKGGIGRQPGRKFEYDQKSKRSNSATSTSILLAKSINELKIKMEPRRQRRIVTSIKKIRKRTLFKSISKNKLSRRIRYNITPRAERISIVYKCT